MLLITLVAGSFLLYRHVNIGQINPVVLLSIHIMRIPVELLYELFRAGELPQVMTFAGLNYDIMVGVTAFLLVLYWVFIRPPAPSLLRAWNVFGLIMLGLIVSLAVLSVPIPWQQIAFEQPNTAVLRFPYTLLPGVVMLLVFVAHLLALNRLNTITA